MDLLNAAQLKTDPERDGVKSDAALIIDFKNKEFYCVVYIMQVK